MKHTLHDNILGEIDYEGMPHTWEFVWPDGYSVYFPDVIKFQAMKTGCYVLFGFIRTHTIPPGWRHCSAWRQD